MAKLSQRHSVRQITNMFNIHFTTVQRQKMRDSLKPSKRTVYPAKIDLKALAADVQAYPDAYQHERAKRFHCSQAAIHQALKKLNISDKKTLSHPKANQADR